ncbi:MAG: 4Fe-4S dicluster domain-containing protein [Candidatus Brocadiia bacterium]
MSEDRRFEIHISAGYCKGCGLCVEFCDQGKLYIRQQPDKRGIQTAAVRPEVECTGCLKCAVICPDAAIEVVRVEDVVGSDIAPE